MAEVDTGLRFKVVDIKTGDDVTDSKNKDGQSYSFFIDSDGILFVSQCDACLDDITSDDLSGKFRVEIVK